MVAAGLAILMSCCSSGISQSSRFLGAGSSGDLEELKDVRGRRDLEMLIRRLIIDNTDCELSESLRLRITLDGPPPTGQWVTEFADRGCLGRLNLVSVSVDSETQVVFFLRSAVNPLTYVVLCRFSEEDNRWNISWPSLFPGLA